MSVLAAQGEHLSETEELGGGSDREVWYRTHGRILDVGSSFGHASRPGTLLGNGLQRYYPNKILFFCQCLSVFA